MSKNTKRIADYVNTAKSKAKNIFQIIRENAREIIQNAEAWFNSHAKELKAVGIKSVSTLLTLATLLTASMGLTGCNSFSGRYDESIPAAIATRSPDEIAETGVKAEDVLAQLDLMSKDMYTKLQKLYQRSYPEYNVKDEDIDQIAVRFDNFTNQKIEYGDSASYDYPFFFEETIWTNGIWLKDKITDELPIADVSNYGLICNMTANFQGKTAKTSFMVRFPSDIFEKLMASLGKEQSILTPKIMSQYPDVFIDDSLTGATIYDAFNIDREYINTLSPEELAVLYQTLQNMRFFVENTLDGNYKYSPINTDDAIENSEFNIN